MNLIEGVTVENFRVMCDERVWLIEILRYDDEIFSKFGQMYITTVYPGAVKAWNYHKKQTDHLTCIRGMMKVVLYDGMEGSRTYKLINEFFIGHHNSIVIKVLPMIYYELYYYKNPDEHHLPPETREIDFDRGLPWE
ncbi:MAG: dTDP-4-dehydrorhamnose 3,5-epimerase family protein [Candidatus Methanoperedens sp.]|nr:dTDP-4-dehydrorhamnose 3,5-epimerase family protein [Candidatus Methanoperedens sp.]